MDKKNLSNFEPIRSWNLFLYKIKKANYEVIIIKSLLDEFMLKLSVDALPGATNYEGEIFHYTSLKNINSILQLNDDKITLWASRFDCLNDISEGTLVKEAYREACDELKENGQISNEMYNLFSNIPPSKNETFIVWKLLRILQTYLAVMFITRKK